MKRIVLIFMFIFLTSMPTFSNNYVLIDKLENSIFGMTYSGQDEKSRIERLEKNVYGAIQTGNINNRIDKLSKDMSAELLGQEITPTKYTEFEEEEDNTVDYPLIDDFEKKIFNQEFRNKKLEQRLSNLEKKVFNKTYENDDLSTRTDRLKTSIHINDLTKDENNIYKDYETFSYDNFSDFDYDGYNNNGEYNNLTKYNNYFAEANSDYTDYNPLKNFSKPEEFENKNINNSYKYDANLEKVLNALEKKILKKTYPNDNDEIRIDRLEENMFSTTFSQDSIETRLERLATAYQATKSANKYDTNKLSQHMATAMQVGVFLLMILAMVL